MSKIIDFYAFGPGVHDFYRCLRCNRIFTHEYERSRIADMQTRNDDRMHIHCTSKKYSPTRPYLFEWLLPWVLAYTAKLVLARAAYPWAELRGYHRIQRVVEFLASNRLTR